MTEASRFQNIAVLIDAENAALNKLADILTISANVDQSQ